jgi:hypothetical protein
MFGSASVVVHVSAISLSQDEQPVVLYHGCWRFVHFEQAAAELWYLSCNVSTHSAPNGTSSTFY